MESSGKDLQRRVDDISLWEIYITGIRGLTPEQEKEFKAARFFLDKARLAAMQNQKRKLQVCLATAKEHEVKSGVDFSTTYKEIERYSSENTIYSP